ncbi:hypothetical protein LAZ67_13000996 [Cordylochernes scorpioides]|uniref:CCHC-type domain-containing protein n=1 Tax=Cordylochernes scorpioides TaxID=51811 RepID=A0ABY6L3X0_9ARAC|nr:hypothetical protein LAZ67_13000996 [Cordylochernes scorpioides]
MRGSNIKGPRKETSFTDKLKIVDQLKNGPSGSSSVRKYGVENATISNIKKNSEAITNYASSPDNEDGSWYRKAMKMAENKDLDAARLRDLASKKRTSALRQKKFMEFIHDLFLSSNPVAFYFQTPSRVLIIPNCMLQLPLKRLRFNQSSPFKSNNKKFRNDIVTERLSRQDKDIMELNQDPIGVKSDGPTETAERRQEVRETGETTAPLADAVTLLSALLTRVKISDGAEATIALFDGTYSATQFFQAFDRKMEDASMGEQEKLLRLPNYLVRQPLELFRKLRLADRSYFQVRQILLDLYPESSEASFAKYFAMKLTGQANLETYYREKTAMGLQLGLPQEVILETLTEGLPFNDQRLVRVVPPENLGEWFRLVQRIHGPSVPTTRPREDQPPTMSGPYHNTPRRPVLAVSQDKDLHGGMIPIEVAEMEVDLSTIKDSTNNCLNPGVSDGHANSFVKNGGYVNPAKAKIENWAEQVEAAEKDNNTEPFESVHRKKRKRFDSKSQRAQIVRPDASSPKPSGQLRRTTKESVTHVRNTRQEQALNKARSEATSFDQCCYVEWCADFHHVHYMKALEELLGKDSVYQLMKKSGHAMVALASIEKAERLVENGLTINNTFLRAFPYRRKAEKIILGNLPIAVREEDIIEALRPYCRVVSLAYEVVSCNGYTWTTGNREAFVLLNEGRKLHQLPAKLVIISKGESTPAYVTYGVRCSRCHRQGHRRATCPQGTRSGPVLTPPPSLPTPSHSFTATTSAEGNSGTIQTIHVTPPNPAASSPAESCPVLSQNTPATKPSTPAPSTSVLPSLLAPSSTTTSPTADPAKDQAKTALTMGCSVPKPQTTQLPQLTLQKVEDLFKVLDADSFLEPLYMDYHRWEIEKAVVCPTMREDVFTYLSPEQISALKKFLDKAIAHVGDKDSDLGKRVPGMTTNGVLLSNEMAPQTITPCCGPVWCSTVRPRSTRCPGRLQTRLRLSSGRSKKRDSSLKTIRPQSAQF